jgi:putative phage-type endonuclease
MAAIPQRSEGWYAARCGKVTASRMTDVLAKGRSGGPSLMRMDYIAELVCERLTGIPYRSAYQSAEMRWGIENEDGAALAYEVETGNQTELCSVVDHPMLPNCAATPDRMAGAGLLEIKCPKTRTHFEYMQGGTAPTEYVGQMTLQLACTKRQWVDFVSYDPRLPEDLQLFIVRFEPLPAMIEAVEAEVQRFEAEVIRRLEEVQMTRKLRAAARGLQLA